MITVDFQVNEEEFLRELAAAEMEVSSKMLRVMEQVGWETVSYLRSLTSEQRPPARPGDPNRAAHPGHWADITGNLANAYTFELWVGGQRVRWSEPGRGINVSGAIPTAPQGAMELRFLNTMEYAAALEARDGYWIIREITGGGGPVAQALRIVINRIAPGARIEGV